MSRNDLRNAQKAKQDEFYTQLSDIEKEMRYYRAFFEGKTVFCNCDDPFESNFFKYFAMNYNFLKLKKLICTCYAGSPISHTELDDLPLFGQNNNSKKMPYMIQVSEVTDQNGDGAVDMTDIETLLRNDKNLLTILDGDGDFRSEESIGWLKEADIVVTNPPFSLFREFVSTLEKYNKNYIIMGNTNALTYREIFQLFKNDRIRTGYTNFNVGMYFYVPDYFDNYHKIVNNKKMVRVSTSCWFTNLPVSKHKENLIMFKKYSPEKYPKYANYDAININKASEMPSDYDGIMGVPITFLDKFNPEQFEIVALGNSRENFTPNKTFINPKKHLKTGEIKDGGAINCVLTLEQEEPPVGKVYYTSDNSKYLVPPYARILIRKKQ